jgi:hypothetical protein
MIGTDVHDLARPLRPQGFGSTRPREIVDALVEPAWPGIRVLAAADGARGTIWADGEILEDHQEVAAALRRAAAGAVEGAIFDGYLTKQIASEGVGVKTWVPAYPTVAGQMSRMFIGGRRNRLDELEKRQEAELEDMRFDDVEVVNLVVVDLLWLDGQWLLDVPLLERKRLLAAVLPGDPIVRASMYVRPPIETWIGSWRAQGFRGLAFKAANSRYRPGEVAPDWITMPMPRR